METLAPLNCFHITLIMNDEGSLNVNICTVLVWKITDNKLYISSKTYSVSMMF